jgi:hypothetical protein
MRSLPVAGIWSLRRGWRAALHRVHGLADDRARHASRTGSAREEVDVWKPPLTNKKLRFHVDRVAIVTVGLPGDPRLGWEELERQIAARGATA